MNQKKTKASMYSRIAKIAVLFVIALLTVGTQVVYGNPAGFIAEAVDGLQLIVVAIGGGLGVWGVINLLEGYGNDNPGAKSQGIKQLMAGLGIMIMGFTLVPQLATLF